MYVNTLQHFHGRDDCRISALPSELLRHPFQFEYRFPLLFDLDMAVDIHSWDEAPSESNTPLVVVARKCKGGSLMI